MAALLARGLAENTGDGQYPTLTASPRSRPILRGEEKFYILRTAIKEKTRRRPAPAVTEAGDGYGDFSEGLWLCLKAARKERAEADGIPPYMVFSDRSLREMTQRQPADSEQFQNITGVGRHKLEVYGHFFLHVIDDYLREHPRERSSEGGPAARRGEVKVDQPYKFSEPKTTPQPRLGRKSGSEPSSPPDRGGAGPTGELLRQGLNLDQVAKIRGLARSTIIHHLEKLLQAGGQFSAAAIMSETRLAEIGRAFEAIYGNEEWARLKPVVEGSNNDISYDEARLARAFLKPCIPPAGPQGEQ